MHIFVFVFVVVRRLRMRVHAKPLHMYTVYNNKSQGTPTTKIGFPPFVPPSPPLELCRKGCPCCDRPGAIVKMNGNLSKAHRNVYVAFFQEVDPLLIQGRVDHLLDEFPNEHFTFSIEKVLVCGRIYPKIALFPTRSSKKSDLLGDQ